MPYEGLIPPTDGSFAAGVVVVVGGLLDEFDEGELQGLGKGSLFSTPRCPLALSKVNILSLNFSLNLHWKANT